jgi:integrase
MESKISLLKEGERFGLFLQRKNLSEETQKLYLLFLEKLIYLINETGSELNQDLIDSFLDVYPHAVSRAFLKNYFEFIQRRDLYLVKRKSDAHKKVVKVIPENEIPAIREQLYNYDDRFGLIFDLSLNCGLRRQEALRIKAEDCQIKEDDKMFILIKHGKGNKERYVFVTKDIAILIIHFCLNNNLKPSDYLFRSKLNPEKNINKSYWNQIFKRACYDATGKNYHPHQLRHTRAIEWYNNGVDIVRIQQRLGHSSIGTTNIYVNPDKEQELKKWSNEE